jgi:thioester reductase-like protein
VTGATGFLGARLVAELARQSGRPVHMLVRASDTDDALGRVRRAFEDARLDWISSPVGTWDGDATARNLGLSDDLYARLAERVSCVVHVAGAVNQVLSLEDQLDANVRSAAEVVRFARDGRRKRLYHVSTLATLLSTDLSAPIVDEHSDPLEAQVVHGGYAQSKWIGEAVVRAALAESCIVRPGLLTGDTRTGIASRHCPLAWFLHGLARVGAVPEGDHEHLRVDVTPVDWAAAALAAHVVDGHEAQVLHLSSERGASLAELLRALAAEGFPVSPVAPAVFVERVRTLLPRDAAMALLGASPRLLGGEAHRDLDLFLLTDRTLRAAAHPSVDDALLRFYVKHAVGTP